MKKIIGGRKYDTETAKELGSSWNGLSPTDFNYCSEKLYQKKTGEFFLYGKGGARSQYAEQEGGTWYGGEDITPYTEDEAKRWCENHLSVEEYEAIFGEVEE